MGDMAFAQLLEMGIPAGRASAALRRAKGDVMAAAERVFAGEFDDIPPDDEGEIQDNAKLQGGLRTSEDTPNNLSRRKPAAARGERDIIEIDGDDCDADDDFFQAVGADDNIQEDEQAESNRGGLSDPYAGIFFSKDRSETVIETVSEPEYALLSLPASRKGSGQTSADDASEPLTKVPLLQLGEWMSGCPEGNEQSFLFQLYSYLIEGVVSCPAGCGSRIKRKKQDFFAILPSFPQYLEYLADVIRPKCGRCTQHICLACGDRVDKVCGTQTSKGKGKGKDTTPMHLEVDELLHCVNIQGVLIGMGLYMIEQAFPSWKPLSSVPNDTTAGVQKKRKAGHISPIKGHLESLKKAMKGSSLDPLDKENASPIGEDMSPYSQLMFNDDDYDDYEDYAYGMLTGGGGTASRPSAKGTGYAGAVVEDRSGQIAAQAAQDERDTETARLLSQVQIYLPAVNRNSGARTSDHLVHPTALAHLRRRSGFVNELLRNDSLLDMSNRGALYRALFDWLEVISSHEALASMLAMPQMRPASRTPLPEVPDCVSVVYEGASSPRELLESVVIQAQAAMKGLDATAEKQKEGDESDEERLRLSTKEAAKREQQRLTEMRTDENVILRSFCERIVSSAETIDRSLVETKGKAFVKRMKESLPRLPEGSTSMEQVAAQGMSDEAVIKLYVEWVTKTRFQYLDLSYKDDGGQVAYHHAYNKNVLAIGNESAPKRSLAIATELAILTTSLPAAWHSSIFLRVDEARVDCIKAMIIGPEGTPYQNGCFLFDIHLPLDYNHKCPMVKSVTTNGGQYRYNPNLYTDGKVCLSLLGTWSGPGWIAGQSTLLQVLISIQSLILCEEPYLTSPRLPPYRRSRKDPDCSGWASSGGSPASKSYSANVRRMVLVDAMANNIKSPPKAFENEIRTHFRLKRSSIRKQIKEWKKLDNGQSTETEGFGRVGSHVGFGDGKTAFDKAASELKKLLDELE